MAGTPNYGHLTRKNNARESEMSSNRTESPTEVTSFSAKRREPIFNLAFKRSLSWQKATAEWQNRWIYGGWICVAIWMCYAELANLQSVCRMIKVFQLIDTCVKKPFLEFFI